MKEVVYMQRCDKCKVNITGQHERCPLCHGALHGDKTEEVFPVIPTVYSRHGLFMKISLFISVVAAVCCLAVNWMFPTGVWWSLFVLAGLVSMWLSLVVAIRKRANIPKNILMQVALLSVLAVLWDLCTGWNRWSVIYALPIVCTIAMIAMAAAARIQNLKVADYLIYLAIDAVFGLIPLILLLTGSLGSVVYPSVICVAGSAISLTALFIFQGETLREEFAKRFHL